MPSSPPAEGLGLSIRSVLSSLCSTFLGVLSFLSLSPGSRRGADGTCQRLLRVTDEELEVGEGGRELERVELSARSPVQPRHRGCGWPLWGPHSPFFQFLPTPGEAQEKP